MAIDVEDYYRRYGPMVMRRCRAMLGDEDRAHDAMHDVFVQVLRRSDALTGEAPSSLLYRIATNTCLNQLRSERRRPEVPGGDLLYRIAMSEDTEARTSARSLLGRLFGREQPSTRTIAVMHLLEGRTLTEVADAVGMSVSGVRKRLRKLRHDLGELEATTA